MLDCVEYNVVETARDVKGAVEELKIATTWVVWLRAVTVARVMSRLTTDIDLAADIRNAPAAGNASASCSSSSSAWSSSSSTDRAPTPPCPTSPSSSQPTGRVAPARQPATRCIARACLSARRHCPLPDRRALNPRSRQKCKSPMSRAGDRAGGGGCGSTGHEMTARTPIDLYLAIVVTSLPTGWQAKL